MYCSRRNIQLRPIEDEKTKKMKKALRNLEPSRKHIEGIEAKRVGFVMNNAKEDITYALILSGYTSEKYRTIENMTLRNLIMNHGEISEKILHQNVNDNKEFLEAKNSFKSSTKLIISHFREQDSKEFQDTFSQTPRAFIDGMQELWRIAQERLLTNPEEEQKRLEYLNMILQRSRRSHDMMMSLQRQLEEKMDEKEHEIAVQDLKLTLLVNELDNAKRDAEDEQQKILSDANRYIHNENKNLEKNTKQYMEEIMELKQRLKTARKEHYENETVLRKKRFKLTTELQNWITKYDEDLQWRQEEIEELLQLQEVNRSDLQELDKQVGKLQIKYEEIQEERRIKEEQERLEFEELQRKNEAAARIQAIWKGYVVRQTLAGKVVGAFKKGKGKKKKGKKK